MENTQERLEKKKNSSEKAEDVTKKLNTLIESDENLRQMREDLKLKIDSEEEYEKDLVDFREKMVEVVEKLGNNDFEMGQILMELWFARFYNEVGLYNFSDNAYEGVLTMVGNKFKDDDSLFNKIDEEFCNVQQQS